MQKPPSGIELMNFALRVDGQLKLSASDSLKGLLDSLGSFFGGGRRGNLPGWRSDSPRWWSKLAR